MPVVTSTDIMRTRTVGNHVRLIREHLEAMQRDVHGLEYEPWKREVDSAWKRIFEHINLMRPGLQQDALNSIRELWMAYLTHYAGLGGSSRWPAANPSSGPGEDGQVGTSVSEGS